MTGSAAEDVNTEISKIEYDKDTKIIVYCRSGNRSNMAAEELLSLGYKNIYDLGSMDNY
jgi:rhodanese-related sulfurtransferase